MKFRVKIGPHTFSACQGDLSAHLPINASKLCDKVSKGQESCLLSVLVCCLALSPSLSSSSFSNTLNVNCLGETNERKKAFTSMGICAYMSSVNQRIDNLKETEEEVQRPRPWRWLIDHHRCELLTPFCCRQPSSVSPAFSLVTSTPAF